MADIDIDDAQGIEHIFQVVRTSVSGPANPYDIRAVLIMDQHLDPGHSFVFGRAAALS